jgi:hypothetical protein
MTVQMLDAASSLNNYYIFINPEENSEMKTK